MFGNRSQFDKELDKATSQLPAEPDWDSILKICGFIRQEDVQPRYALNSIRKKINSDNPTVSFFALQVLESCVKNCGTSFHLELANKNFMEFLYNLAKSRDNPVRTKILELVQVWSHAFCREPHYKVIGDIYSLLKLEGYNFPALREADAMFSTERAPEWKDGDVCIKCRVTFSMIQRKHHCRACGEVFCNKCSGKTSTLPKFGIEKVVRVCDSCYEKLNPVSAKGDAPRNTAQVPKSAQEIKEEEELQMALAIAKSEVETGSLREEEDLQMALALSRSEEINKSVQEENVPSSGASGSSLEEITSATPPATGIVQSSVDMGNSNHDYASLVSRLDEIEHKRELDNDFGSSRYMRELERKIDRQENLIQELFRTNSEQRQELDLLEKRVASLEVNPADVNTDEKETSRQELSVSADETVTATRTKETETVAFTACIDHNIEQLELDQVILFNKVLTNIGNGYDVHKGVFLCPEKGVYLFTFFISEYGNKHTDAKLVVDWMNQLDAIVDPQGEGHNLQGGNAAVLQLAQGQRVWVGNYCNNGASTSSEKKYRFGSFTGVKLS